MTKPRINIHVTPEADALLRRAVRDGAASKAAVVDAAIKQLLDAEPDERALQRIAQRLDKLTRAMERMADEGIAQTETLALFILYYLCVTPPVPESLRGGAEAAGRKRFEHFIGQVGARLASKERTTDAILATIDLGRPDKAEPTERAA
ncbi:MAG: CopG family transcriptional regulator [Parvularculaceae bacterium]